MEAKTDLGLIRVQLAQNLVPCRDSNWEEVQQQNKSKESYGKASHSSNVGIPNKGSESLYTLRLHPRAAQISKERKRKDYQHTRRTVPIVCAFPFLLRLIYLFDARRDLKEAGVAVGHCW